MTRQQLIEKYEIELADAKKLTGDSAYTAVKIFEQIVKDLKNQN